MRVIHVPVALAAVLALAPAAFAATHTTTGDIKSMDMKAHTLTLANGKMYSLPTSVKTAGLKTGEKVTVSWTMSDGKYRASAVKAAD